MKKSIIAQWREDLFIDSNNPNFQHDSITTLQLLSENINDDKFHVIVMTLEGVQREHATIEKIGEYLKDFYTVYIDTSHYKKNEWVSIPIPKTKTTTEPQKPPTKTITLKNH